MVPIYMCFWHVNAVNIPLVSMFIQYHKFCALVAVLSLVLSFFRCLCTLSRSLDQTLSFDMHANDHSIIITVGLQIYTLTQVCKNTNCTILKK